MSHCPRWVVVLKIMMCVFFLGCLSALAQLPDGATVAVWDLEYLSLGPNEHQDISEILSAKIVETFRESGRYEIVEREKLLLVLEELNVGTSSLADDSTRLKIGRIIGAKYMVFGTCFVMTGSMRIDLRLVEVESGNVIKAAQKTTQTTDPIEWINLAAEAGRDLF